MSILTGVVFASVIFAVRMVNTKSTPTDTTRVLSASWEDSYRSLSDLTAAAPYIVVGTVVADAGQRQDDFSAGDMRGGALVFTDFQFHVSEVLKGDVTNERLIVHQTGGRANGVLMEVEDDPLFVVGAHYVLYLKYDEPSGRYFVLGGPDGRLELQGERAHSLSQDFPDRGISDLYLQGIPLSQLRAAARQ
jgi:hypothetical protein